VEQSEAALLEAELEIYKHSNHFYNPCLLLRHSLTVLAEFLVALPVAGVA
jgi:hypothetical protein